MQDGVSSGSGQHPPEDAGPKTEDAGPKTGRSRQVKLVACVAGGALAVGIGFGAGAVIKLAGSPRSAVASSVIPSPPRANALFVEDDNGTGQDNQENILQDTAPGLVHIVSSGGASAGLGLVLTPSGKVLTSDQILRGAHQVTVRVVLSGRAFTADVVGSDAAEHLALLQIQGGSRFTPATIGTSRDLAVGDEVTSVGGAGMTRTFTLYLGNVTSLNSAAAVGGRRLTGLLRTATQRVGSQEIGGPLVNLSGQVVGIDVAGAGGGLHSAELAIPVNQALAVAKRIDAQNS